MVKCPCCSQNLLRYIRKEGTYWFCPHCWQEMPDLVSMIEDRKQKSQLNYLSSLTSQVTPIVQAS